MAKIIDNDGNGDIIYESSLPNCKEVHRVLLADPRNISEQDEVMYEHEMRTICFRGKLKIVE